MPRCRRRAPTSSAAPPSTRRIAISSSDARRCSTRSCRSSRRCARGSTRCAAPGAQWADGWARDFNALCTAHGFLARHLAPAADALRRGGEAADPGGRHDRVLRRRRLPLRDGRGALSPTRRHPGDHGATQSPAGRAADCDRGGHERARAGRDERSAHPSMSSDTGAVRGFSTGEFRVSDPETRKRAMHDRVGGATCPWLTLEEVVEPRQRVAQALDRPGAARRRPQPGDRQRRREGCRSRRVRHVMQKLRAAWRLLRDAGVRRFVFTSDHGFLLLDDSAAPAQAARPPHRSEAPARASRRSPRTTRARSGWRSPTSATTAWTGT